MAFTEKKYKQINKLDFKGAKIKAYTIVTIKTFFFLYRPIQNVKQCRCKLSSNTRIC